MVSLGTTTENLKALSNLAVRDTLVDEALMTVDEATAPVDALGLPITKADKNNKSLTNAAENI